ncbi:EamA family transporter [Roseiconus lacunae]|uniref:DMT family transporter n=1 Tax=Roseiconus lacunae TaxID=2605694 RepID=A0ABT7PMY4_9BACT|nr:DMT family transporter [Roseiconus lacunae]MCD0462634.1 DMT family transporter [Roseiconus lacunae]MDM4017872.1 DMT family transporter [Roseiconus lacunae]WRQ52553.1 DMT family transporter [Stieleria sp. HD01]
MLTWMFLSVISALLLGFYDSAKKMAVNKNAVPIVLLCSVSIGAVLYLPLMTVSVITPDLIQADWLRIKSLSWSQHGLVLAKSLLVGASWTLAFTALKHLPLSIGAPIRATSPFWTILIAVSLLGERPRPIQWAGMLIVLFGFWCFTLVGRREGVRFFRDRSVLLMVIATLLGSCSSIYDKWLLQRLEPITLQAWFTVYLVPVMVPLALWWHRASRRGEIRSPDGTPAVFHWRRSIALVSPLLIAADAFYFIALSDPDAMVSVVSVVRRCSVVVALAFGASALSEANFRAKSLCVGVILLGVVILTWKP